MSGQILPFWPRTARGKWIERRASSRSSPRQEVLCYCELHPEEVSIPARVCNISAGGVCLIMNHPVEPGTELTVELINEMHTFLCTRSLRVSRSYLGDNDECVFAGDFDHNLEYDELVPFLL